MRILEMKVYPFNELTEDAKQKAIEKLYDINFFDGWYEDIYFDAANIGLKIEGFELDRGSYCEGVLTAPAETVIEKILAEHGDTCETYKTADQYQKKFAAVKMKEKLLNEDDEDMREDLTSEFVDALLEDFRVILQQEYDYRTSEEAIIEAIEANDYEFEEDGTLV